MEEPLTNSGWKDSPGIPTRTLVSPTALDIIACAFILVTGLLSFHFYQRSPDFPYEDVSYVELAKSLLHDGSYAFNFKMEKVQPPGFPALLALLCATLGCTHNVLVRAMPVFFTLGLLASYVLIRRVMGCRVAAASCLLLSSSPVFFSAVTARLWPSFPYLFTSMLVLLIAPNVEAAKTKRMKFLLATLLCFLLVASVLIQSAGIALIGGLLCWLILSFLDDRATARSRLKIYLPIVLVALFAEALWMHQGSNPREWPLSGFPGSYMSQLKLKNGNNPELGLASTADIVSRVDKNLRERTSLFVELMMRHWISPSYSTVGSSVPLILILIGVWSSILRRENQILTWYFIGHESIHLLWPWTLEVRFFLPVAPLACLYFFKGITAFAAWARQYPRRVGAWCLPLFSVVGIHSAIRGWQAEVASGWQWKFSAMFWIFSATLAARMIWSGPLHFFERVHSELGLFGKRYSVRKRSFTVEQAMGAMVVVSLIAIGMVKEIPIARANLSFDEAQLYAIPDIQGARWIASHAEPDAIVAARRVPLVYHYAHRKVVWFPPISNPRVLLQGIREHNIRYIIVIERDFSYYLPPDEYCFKLLSEAFAEAFRLVEASDRVKIYEVLPERSR